MNSIFDDEEQVVYRQSRMTMPMLAPMATGSGYLMPSSSPTLERATYVVDDKRKRTVLEALERLPPPPQTTGLPFGVQRLARKPLMIYTAAYFLAAGFVIVDPLDRLDGGLID